MEKCCKKDYPDHSSQIGRLNRSLGQIEGIKKMIEERRYCVDILTQLKAVRAAIRSIEANILESHMQQCLEEACSNNDKDEVSTKINELIKLLKAY